MDISLPSSEPEWLAKEYKHRPIENYSEFHCSGKILSSACIMSFFKIRNDRKALALL